MDKSSRPAQEGEKRRGRYRLRTYLLLLVLIATVPLLVAGGAITLWQAQERRNAVEHSLISTARSLVLAVDREVAASIAALDTLSVARVIDEREWTRFEALARDLSRKRGWDAVALLDESGRQHVNLNRRPGEDLPPSRSGAEHQTIRTGQPAVSNLFTGAVARKPIVTVAVPVVRAERALYALEAVIEPAVWRDLLQKQGVSQAWVLTLFDRDMKVIARSVEHERFLGREAPSWMTQRFTNRVQGTAGGEALDGGDVVAGFHRSELTGWTVAVSAPAAILSGPFTGIVGIGAAIVAALFALSLLAALFVARRISAPLTRLASAAQAYSSGAAPAPVRRSSVIEFEDLRRALRSAAAHATQQTERKQSEAAAAEMRFRAAQDAALDGFMIYRPIRASDGKVTDLEVLYANPQAAQYAGLPREQIVGHPISEIVPGARRPGGLIERHAGVLESRSAHEDVLPMRSPGGALRLFRNMVVPFDGLIAATFRDVTESVRHREELEAARRQADEANAAKSRFLAAASHDLRQPYQAMRTFYRLLIDNLRNPAHLSIAYSLGEAMRTGEDLLNALLDVSTLDSGRIKPAIAAVPMATMLEQVRNEFAPVAAQRGLAFTVRACNRPVRSDPVLLKRIVANLVSNALRHTERGGVVVGCRTRGEDLLVEVWDTGPGIPEEAMPLIWEDFYQLGKEQRERGEGLGLGLSIVRRMADLLGHEVSAASRPGRGSVFRLRLPLAAGELPAPSLPAATVQVPRSHRVLLVEDDAIQRIGLKELLESWGHSVRMARDAPEAMAAAGDPPTLIVSDLRLPGQVDGVAMVESLRSAIGIPVPAVLITGDTSPDAMRAAQEAGCAIMHKPFDPERLKTMLDTAESR
jgi:signal transduction histidine kinase